MQTPPKAILFDFDGTLVDSEPLHYESWLHAVKPYGAFTDWDDYVKRFVGQTGRWAAHRFFDDAGVAYSDDLVLEVIRAKTSHFRQYAHKRLIMHQSTIDAISQLPKSLPIGVVSSSSSQDVEPVLIAAGLRSRLGVLICSADVKQHKPHPEPYLVALEGLRAHAPTLDLTPAVVAVYEDSPSGIASGTAAGMAVRRVASPEAVPGMLDQETWI